MSPVGTPSQEPAISPAPVSPEGGAASLWWGAIPAWGGE